MTTVTRQDVLKIEAIGKLTDGGMGALYRWYSALPADDRALLDDFIVKPGSVPVVDVEPEDAEPTPEAVTVRKTYFEYECQKCHTVWSWPMAWCAECGNGFEEATRRQHR